MNASTSPLLFSQRDEIAIGSVRVGSEQDGNLKTLLVSAAFPPMAMGEADHAFHLGKALAAHGFDVHVLTSAGAVTASDHGVTVHPTMRRWSWREVPRLIRCLQTVAPDVVLLLYVGVVYDDHPMITFLPTVVRRLRPSAAVVTQFENVYGTIPTSCTWPVRIARRAVKTWAGATDVDYEFGTLFRDSDGFIALSESHIAKLAQRVEHLRPRTTLVPPAPLLPISAPMSSMARAQVRQRLGVGSSDFLLTYFGYTYRGKGIETLLRAYQRLSSSRPELRLAFVGGTASLKFPDHPGYSGEMIELAAALGVESQIIRTGEYSWDSDEASQYLRASDACVLPLDSGVYLNNSSLAAAAAHGLPLIVTRGASADTPMVHGENVFFCEPRSPGALAAAIETVLTAPALRARLGEGAARLAAEWFNWTRVAERTSSALANAVRGRLRVTAV